MPPFCKVDGADHVRGLNTVGLRRAGFSEEDIKGLDRAYRRLFIGRKKPFSVAMAELESLNGELTEHAIHLLGVPPPPQHAIATGDISKACAPRAPTPSPPPSAELSNGPRPAQASAATAAQVRSNGSPDGQVLLQDTTTCTGPYATPGVDLAGGTAATATANGEFKPQDISAVINVTALEAPHARRESTTSPSKNPPTTSPTPPPPAA